MSSHQRILDKMYAHPLSSNVEWKDVIHMLNFLGTTEDAGHGSLRATVNGYTDVFHHTDNKILSHDQVVQMRHFLVVCGLPPAQRPKKKAP